jgi:hypothetical protein
MLRNRIGQRAAIFLAVLAVGCDRSTSTEIRATVEAEVEAAQTEVDAARTEVGGTVEAAVQQRVEAAQTAGLATTAAGVVVKAEEAMDVVKEVAAWVGRTGAALATLTASQEALADDPTLIADGEWLTDMTNSAADLRTSGQDAVALADIISSKGVVAVAEEPLAEVGAELISTADALDAALEVGTAADVAAATPNLTELLDQVHAIRDLVQAR